MPTYISSNANRFYAVVETAYGQAAVPSSANRYPAIRLQAQQLLEPGKRLDKTGTRSFLGTSPNARRHTAFETRTYLSSWNASGQPAYSALFQSAMGAVQELSTELTVGAIPAPTQIQTTNAHRLVVGSAISFLNEIRFVTAVPDSLTITFNARFHQPASDRSDVGTDHQLFSVDCTTKFDALRLLGSGYRSEPNCNRGSSR